jgi:predicted glycoside hydrolase/deacetylase ChbG (UPF0249 family)
VTRASALANGASFARALPAAHAAGLPVGLHVNLTEGAPLSPLHAVASLLDPANGRFMRGKAGFRAAVASGAVEVSEVTLEVRAQLLAFTQAHPTGALPSHWDGHQHVQTLPLVLAALVPVLVRVSSCRLPLLGGDELSVLGPGSARAAFYERVDVEARAALPAYTTAGFAFPSAFVGYTTMGAEMGVQGRVTAVLGRALAAAHAGNGVVEWMVHPGRTSPPGVDGSAPPAGCGDGPDAFALSPDRQAEVEVLLDRDGGVRRWLAEQGVTLVGGGRPP